MFRSSFPSASQCIPALCTALLLLAIPARASAQMPPMPDMEPVPPPEQLPVPFKMSGIGNSHIAIKASPEAQAWFDQGLSLFHDFWDYESAKAFEQSIRADPKCAMCQWGLAAALEMHGDDAVRPYVKQALATAERLKSHAGAPEKLYIDAAQADLSSSERGKSPAIPILRKLVKKAPHDIEAASSLLKPWATATTKRVSPRPAKRSVLRSLKGFCARRPTILPLITTGFTPWNPAIIQNARFRAQLCSPASRVYW